MKKIAYVLPVALLLVAGGASAAAPTYVDVASTTDAMAATVFTNVSNILPYILGAFIPLVFLAIAWRYIKGFLAF